MVFGGVVLFYDWVLVVISQQWQELRRCIVRGHSSSLHPAPPLSAVGHAISDGCYPSKQAAKRSREEA